MKTKDAKERFIKSGTIRDNFIRKEILSSWERSRIYKVPQEVYDLCLNNSSEIKQDLQDGFKNKIFGQVMLVDLGGNIIYRMGDDLKLNAFKNIEEKRIGTTAFSVSFISQHYECVEKNEHYINFLEKYNSYSRYNVNEKKWFVLFSERSWLNTEFDDLEATCIESYKNWKKENELLQTDICANVVNKEKIQKEVILAGISREILAAKRHLESLSCNVVNLVLITNCQLTLQAMVQMIVEKRQKNSKINMEFKCTAIDSNCSYNLQVLNSSAIIYVENIHLFSYKLQMDLARYLQQKPKEQCILWGFYSAQDQETIQETTLPLIFDYLKGTQIVLRDIDTRSADIKFISQKYVAMNYPNLFADPLFYVSVSKLKQARSLELLLNYLKFKCDMNSQTQYLSVDKTDYQEPLQAPYADVTENQDEVCTGYKLQDMEREQVEKALRANQYQLAKTAKSLGIGRTTLYRKMKYFKIKVLKNR